MVYTRFILQCNLGFSKLLSTRTKLSLNSLYLFEHCNFTPDFSTQFFSLEDSKNRDSTVYIRTDTIPNSRTLDFSNLPARRDNSNQNQFEFPSLIIFTDFSNYPMFRTTFLFRFVGSKFRYSTNVVYWSC